MFTMGSSLFVAQAARDDAAAVNLAASLRAQVFRLALLAQEQAPVYQLQTASAGLTKTLQAPALLRAIKRDGALTVARHSEVVRIWHRQMRLLLDPAVSGVATYNIPSQLSDIGPLLGRIDLLVDDLQAKAEGRIQLLRFTQSGAILLTIGLAFAAVRRIRAGLTNPLTQLLAGIDRLSAGERDVRIINSPNNEIGRVSEQFNLMAQTLAELQDSLEAEVEAKTEALRRRNEALARESNEDQLRILTEERGIIARELHDSIAQSLSYLKIQVARLQSQMGSPAGDRTTIDDALNELRDGLNTAYQHLRELLVTFRLQLDQPDFCSALQATVEEFANRVPNVDIDLVMASEIPMLSADQRIHLVHIVREALSNALRHAQASRVSITVASIEDATRLVIRVDDNGTGFDVSGTQGMQGHFGLKIMRERAWRLGGSWSIARLDAGGTRIEVGVPLA